MRNVPNVQVILVVRKMRSTGVEKNEIGITNEIMKNNLHFSVFRVEMSSRMNKSIHRLDFHVHDWRQWPRPTKQFIAYVNDAYDTDSSQNANRIHNLEYSMLVRRTRVTKKKNRSSQSYCVSIPFSGKLNEYELHCRYLL